VTNGTFASGTTGWTFDAAATDTSTAGFLSGTTGAGTNRLANQVITTVIGKAYRVETTTGPASTSVYVGTSAGSITNGSTGFATSASKSLTFIATTATTYLSVMGVGASVSVSLDSITVRLAEEDRSVNGNGLQVFGTITKTAVATGADLVAYSGFSGSNYLEQPYNADLDFGTGDFSIMCWADFGNINGASTGPKTIWARSGTNTFYLVKRSGSDRLCFQQTGRLAVTGDVPILANTWQQIALTRSGDLFSIYVDGVLGYSGTHSIINMDLADGASLVGQDPSFTQAHMGSLALLRIGATAPSAAQIAKIYNDEKYLFQENAQATLYGTSDAVTALAYDDTTELLHAGTSGGRSVFQGLRRVSNTTDAVGAVISASNGLVAED
jgi:hypothetical protein